jgi:uncharacterized membrane protein
MKALLYTIISIAYMLVTFFGLGPVLLADGGRTERIITLIVVILLYLLLTAITIYLRKILRKR